MPLANTIQKDVFISYSRTDSEFVNRLKSLLTEFGLSVWQDVAEITGGERFWEGIEEGLRMSQTVLAILSQSALESEWVNEELAIRRIQLMEDKTRRLIPVPIPGVKDEDIHYRLRVHNFVDFRAINIKDPLEFKSQVEKLAHHIRGVLPKNNAGVVAIPFVVLAMTRNSASELWAESIFDTSPSARISDCQRLAKLKSALKEHKISDLTQYYGQSPEDWKPIACETKSVRAIINEIISRFNANEEGTDRSLIHPQFFSTEFLSDDQKWRTKTWQRLNEIGSILIVDSLSLFHPDLREHFIQSGIGTSERSSIVIVSPFGPASLPVNQVLEQDIRDQVQATFNRYENLDILCEFGAAELRTLQRWLLTILPQACSIVQSKKANPKRLEAFRKQIDVEPTNIGSAFMGSEQ